MAKILLVDDNLEMQRMLQIALRRKAGHDVTLAKDGKHALELAQEHKYDLILLDVMMPEMDGYTVARTLRAEPTTRKTPILFITARVQELDKEALAASGANGFINKLAGTDEISARINDILLATQPVFGNKVGTAPLPAPAGRSIAVVGCRGGVGTSSVSVNLAALLTRQSHSTCLVDLVPVSGHAALMLNLNPEHSWAELDEHITPNTIGALLLRHSSSLQLFAAPTYAPNTPFNSEKFLALANNLVQMFEEVVFNCASTINAPARGALARADRVIVVVSPETTTVQSALTTINFLQNSLQVSNERLRVVINQASPNLSLSLTNIEKILGRAPDAFLPFESLQASAVVQGIPLSLRETASLPYVMNLKTLVQKL